MAMINSANTLSKFGTSVDGNITREKFYHLQTRYRVRFIGMGVTDDNINLTTNMAEFETPKGDFKPLKIDLVNGELKYPGKWEWQDLTFKLFNTYDNAVYRACYNQIQRQRDIFEQVTGDAPNTYKFTTVFEHTDGHQDSLGYWLMEGCFLQSAQTDGGKNGEHQHMTITCKMSFDNATLYDADGNQIPSTNAGVIIDPTTAFTY